MHSISSGLSKFWARENFFFQPKTILRAASGLSNKRYVKYEVSGAKEKRWRVEGVYGKNIDYKGMRYYG